MKLRIYQADKGDCMVLTGARGGRILVDGGMRDAFRKFVREDLAAQGRTLDLVYISHIDSDHISGIVELLDNLMAWRVYRYRKAAGAKVKAPDFPEPPEVKEIWHNAFSTTIGRNAGAVERLLAQSSLVLGLSSRPGLLSVAQEHHELAYSVKEAIQVSQRIGASQLGIPLNRQFGGKLVMVQPGRASARVGSLDLFVIGPHKSYVEKLRDEWDTWLRENGDAIRTLKKQAEEEARGIGNSADRLSGLLAAKVDELGAESKVTTPNLASVMLMVEEGRRTMLLTGDGHWKHILDGLERQGKVPKGGKLHVDVLKVQHHGSEHNIHQDFCDRVTADHYVFCGNGKHENPDFRVVDLVCKRHRANRPDDTFTLWFNCHPKQAPAGDPKAHMTRLKSQVDVAIRGARGKIRAQWLGAPFFDLAI